VAVVVFCVPDSRGLDWPNLIEKGEIEMLESNFESDIRGDIHNHMVSLIEMGLLAGVIISCALVSFYFGLKVFGDRMAATGFALFVFISLLYFCLICLRIIKQRSCRTQGD